MKKYTVIYLILCSLGIACRSTGPSRYSYLMKDRPSSTTKENPSNDYEEEDYVYVEREIIKDGKRVMVLVKERRKFADREEARPPRRPAKSTNPEVPDFVWPEEKKAPAYSKNEKDYSSNSKADKAIRVAKSYLGVPYVYGGTSRKGMDCSGLVYTAYQAVNTKLPRNSAAMAKTKSGISRNRLRRGDLVFFNSKNTRGINHVGMVVSVRGNDVDFIHASSSRGVRIDQLNQGFWSNKFRKAIRP